MCRRNPTPLPLWPQIKTASQNQGDWVGGRQGEAHHFNPQVTPQSTHPDPLLMPPLLSTPHTPTLLSAPFKGEHTTWNRAVCVAEPPRIRYPCFFLFLIYATFICSLSTPHVIQCRSLVCVRRAGEHNENQTSKHTVLVHFIMLNI